MVHGYGPNCLKIIGLGGIIWATKRKTNNIEREHGGIAFHVRLRISNMVKVA